MIKLRVMLTGVAIASIYVANSGALRAAEGPWCAILNFGSDLAEDCQ
jgi:hypothetical protein